MAVLLGCGALSALLLAQGQQAPRVTLEDRLAAIEDRLDALEHGRSEASAARDREPPPDRLTMEAVAKLDRLEVRVIQLEGRTGGPGGQVAVSGELLARLRALERQVARLRSAALR